MTTRQAVLASVVDSSHVFLSDSYLLFFSSFLNSTTLCCIEEGSRSKKQPLNETELALRREETATRKRKNLGEKKLEDEKVRW
jgi:Ino eighty subunit 2